MEYLLLLVGFALLIFSGRLLITSSVSLASRLKLSSFLIGLTVVAVGTSAPELLVSLTGAIKGHADMAVYNVVGSNVSNILLVLAVAALILPIPVMKDRVWFDGSALLIFCLVFWLFVRDLGISAIEGLIMLLLLAGFILISVNRSRRIPVSGRSTREETPPGMRIWVALLGVVVASGGLALGADLLVDNAIRVAREMGLSERIIAVSMIAVGTSVPELTASAIAAFRKETDISIGNIIGSNIFNLGLVLGITSMVNPLVVNPLVLSFDIFWFAGAAVVLILALLVPRTLELSRWKGLVMLSLYLIYLYLILN
jgi:cation:H+ antiporter